MAFSMAFPWTVFSCDNNSPDIFDGTFYAMSGYASAVPAGAVDSGKELDDGTTVFYTGSYTLNYSDGSKRVFTDVYYYTAGGVLYLSKPLSASVYTAPPFNPDSTYATLQYVFADVQQTGKEDRKATYRTSGGQTFYYGSIAFYYKAGAGSAKMYFSAPDIYYEIYTSAGGMAIKTSVPARQVNW